MGFDVHMTKKDSGGPAFPSAPVYDGNGNGLVEGASGMTLRQWYAGQALAGICAANPKTMAGERVIATACYMLADAMIAEGNKP